MKNIFVIGSLLVIIPALLGGAAACNPNPAINESTVRAYADPATETTLQGMSEDNLAKYTQYGNPEFKAAVTQEVLDKAATQITSQLGTYVSKQYLRVEEQQGYIIVHYKAKYTKNDVGVRMIFDKDHFIAGQFFE